MNERRSFAFRTLPYEYFPCSSVPVHVAVPLNLTPVDFATPGPARRKPSDAVRSLTVSLNRPADNPLERFQRRLVPGPIDAVNVFITGFTGTGGGGVDTLPAVNEPFICVGWASQT